MGVDDMASRQSIDSVRSTSPFLQNRPTFQPPPHDSEDHVRARSDGGATKLKLSIVVLASRIFAFISGLAIGISFAVLGAWRVETIFLIVFTWISVAWNALVLIGPIMRGPSVRISLVLNDGRVIGFGSPGHDESGGRRRRRCPRAFWVDLLLLGVLIALNVVNTLSASSYHRISVNLNWFTIAFTIILTLLTAFPPLATAQVRFESADAPQISLP
ncbi:hypothetical protein F5Y12DRAFT_555705 [Xylaria sp. FL1777]|nr:hypothetical protein F5Y12DRAFT_555705 [Xylaria sp. FL1777]